MCKIHVYGMVMVCIYLCFVCRHPDKNPSSEAEAKFIEINEAYKVRQMCLGSLLSPSLLLLLTSLCNILINLIIFYLHNCLHSYDSTNTSYSAVMMVFTLNSFAVHHHSSWWTLSVGDSMTPLARLRNTPTSASSMTTPPSDASTRLTTYSARLAATSGSTSSTARAPTFTRNSPLRSSEYDILLTVSVKTTNMAS